MIEYVILNLLKELLNYMIIKKSEHYFEYGYDRLCYYEIAQDSLN